MTDHINITGDVALLPEIKTYFGTSLLENIYPKAVYHRDAKKAFIPKNGGKQIEFRRITKLAPDGTTLTEGVPPDSVALAVTKILATAEQKGRIIKYSDVLATTTIDPFLDDVMRQTIPQDGVNVLESGAADVVNAGTNAYFAGSNLARSTVQDTDTLTFTLIQKVERDLQKRSVPTFPDGYYHAIISPDAEFDLKQDPKWVDAYKYAARGITSIYPGEIGMIGRTRFFSSSRAKRFAHQGAGTDALHTTLDGAAAAGQSVIPLTSTTGLATGDVCAIRSANGYFEQEVTIASVSPGVSATIEETLTFAYASGDSFDKGDDVFGTVIYGADAYGTIAIDGMIGDQKVGAASLEVIIKSIGSAGANDGLNQFGTIGWKAMTKTMILDQERIIRIEHGATDATS
jgi:N4-gp56 family major capsid protein